MCQWEAKKICYFLIYALCSDFFVLLCVFGGKKEQPFINCSVSVGREPVNSS